MTHTWRISVNLVTTEDPTPDERVTTAHATLTTTAGTTLEGYGRARRNPVDRDVPEIGEELATARALRDLADRLLNATSDDRSALEHQRIHLYK